MLNSSFRQLAIGTILSNKTFLITKSTSKYEKKIKKNIIYPEANIYLWACMKKCKCNETARNSILTIIINCFQTISSYRLIDKNLQIQIGITWENTIKPTQPLSSCLIKLKTKKIVNFLDPMQWTFLPVNIY